MGGGRGGEGGGGEKRGVEGGGGGDGGLERGGEHGCMTFTIINNSMLQPSQISKYDIIMWPLPSASGEHQKTSVNYRPYHKGPPNKDPSV